MSDKTNIYAHVSEITPGILTNKHIHANYTLIRTGTASERPTKGNAYTSVYLSSDTNVLSFWNKTSESWVSTTLS